jgi:hypothetical protein
LALTTTPTLQPGQQSDETQFLFIAHSSLDIFEEKLANAPASGAAADMYLGLLYPTDTYQVFGYVTNTKAKLVVITDDADVKDLDVKSVRRDSFAVHLLYVQCVFFSLFLSLFDIVVQTIASSLRRCRVQSFLHARRATAIRAL